MPTYDYHCANNGLVVEVNHKMNDTISTWGELCELANVDPGNTPANSPVKKLATGGQIVSSKNLGSPTAPACASGPCCGANACDFAS